MLSHTLLSICSPSGLPRLKALRDYENKKKHAHAVTEAKRR